MNAKTDILKDTRNYGNKRVFELTDSISTDIDSAGNNFTVSALQPVTWLKSIVDAAKKRHYATQFAYKTTVAAGNADVIIPKRSVYIGSGTTWGAQAAEGVAVNYTKINNLCGVTLSPSDYNYGIAISNKAMRVNAIDLVRHAREELTYLVGDSVDKGVFEALRDTTLATATTAQGAQRVMAGNATQASALAAGDTLTTDMIAEAKRKLQSSISQYWTNGTGDTRGSLNKNPWQNEPGSPFVLLIAPEQEEVLLTDSQFVNAAEYGSAEVVNNGEIGKYLGIKVVVTDNTTSYAASATHTDATTTAVAQHRCYMIKSQKAVALATALGPKLYVFDYPSELEKRLVIEHSYKTKALHEDATVFIDCADS